MAEQSLDPIHLSFSVDCDPDHAFDVWTAGRRRGGRRATRCRGRASSMWSFEPRAGGRIFERTPTGVEHDWGRVVAWEPPRRIVYEWHLRQDREDATEVEIRFLPAERGGTRVEIEHRGWERLGTAKGSARREGNFAGWGSLLPHYVRAAGGAVKPVS